MPGRNYTATKTKTPTVGTPVEQAAVLPAESKDSLCSGAQAGAKLALNQPSEDLVLLQKAAAGDGRAFHALLDRHMNRLYRLAVTLVGNAADAEDVLQETFAGAYRGLDGFEGRASVGTWLTRILVMQTARFRRDKRRKPMGSIEASEVNAAELAEGAGAGSSGGSLGTGSVDARIDIQAALLQLSPAHREVLVLREFEQMSYEEIADVLGVPQGTVESRLHRARSELREKLAAYLP